MSNQTSALPLRQTWRLAWPMILSNITVPLLGLVDTAVMGHLSASHYLGAVTLGATLFSFLFWAFGFLRMGASGLTAQALGRGDHADVRLLLAQSLLLAVAIGLLLILLHAPLLQFGLSLLGGSDSVQTHAYSYAQIRIYGAPAALANYALLGWLLGLQHSRATLVLLVFTNLVNIVLDLWFVLGLGMTSDGVALASVIADYSALGLGLWLARRKLRELSDRLPTERLWRWQAYGELLRVNRQLFVRSVCLLFATAFFTAQGARQGDEILAANAVLMQFVMLISYGLDGFAHAAEALVGEAIGARRPALFYQRIKAAACWSLVTALLCMAIFLLAGEQLIALLTDIPAVQASAGQYLPWMIAMPLVSVWSYLLDGVFIGATRTKAMQDSMLVALWLVFLPAWYWTQPLGNHGLWLAFLLFTSARSAGLGWFYWRYSRAGTWFGWQRTDHG